MESYEVPQEVDIEIYKRLKGFREYHEGFLKPLVFCLCTPQADAHKGWDAAGEIVLMLHKYTIPKVEDTLKKHGVRFHKTKAKRIVTVLDRFVDDTAVYFWLKGLKERSATTIDLRNNVVKEIKGFGYKEASHYLRNIGYYDDLCILDRHIMRRLAEADVIDDSMTKLTKKTYLEIEQKMLQYSKEIRVSPGRLDLVFWWHSKGEIFR